MTTKRNSILKKAIKLGLIYANDYLKEVNDKQIADIFRRDIKKMKLALKILENEKKVFKL